MTEEEKIFAGQLFCPGDKELKAIKARAHRLSQEYSQTFEEEMEKRGRILHDLLGKMGDGVFMQGPIFFHYGRHTRIGDHFFGNYNLTVQDDAPVTIGSNCSFGPNVTIVTPVHPMLAEERNAMLDENGEVRHLCYALPVTIGDNCWLAANVVVCSGVTIGKNCVIGAGSVVTRSVPDGVFAAGNPCRVIRRLTDKDSMTEKPEVLAGNQVIE